MSQELTSTPRKRERFRSFPVNVIVTDLATGKVDAEYTFDFNKADSRRWFNEKQLVWALKNGRKVVMTAPPAEANAT